MKRGEMMRRLINERKRQQRIIDKINPKLEGLVAETEEISQHDLAKGRVEALNFAIDLLEKQS